MAKLKKTILRERMLEQLGHENVTVFKGLKEALPGVPDDVIQSMTATVMIACDKGTVYVPGDFDFPAETATGTPAKQEVAPPKEEKPAETAKTNVDFPIGKTETAKELEKKAAYDPSIKGWHCCPTCGSTDITHQRSDNSGLTWQGCRKDKIFLNADGTIKPFPVQKTQQKRI